MGSWMRDSSSCLPQAELPCPGVVAVDSWQEVADTRTAAASAVARRTTELEQEDSWQPRHRP